MRVFGCLLFFSFEYVRYMVLCFSMCIYFFFCVCVHMSGVLWVAGDAEELPFDDAQFDIYTIAFGLRNVTHVELVSASIISFWGGGGYLQSNDVTPLAGMTGVFSSGPARGLAGPEARGQVHLLGVQQGDPSRLSQVSRKCAPCCAVPSTLDRDVHNLLSDFSLRGFTTRTASR